MNTYIVVLLITKQPYWTLLVSAGSVYEFTFTWRKSGLLGILYWPQKGVHPIIRNIMFSNMGVFFWITSACSLRKGRGRIYLGCWWLESLYHIVHYTCFVWLSWTCFCFILFVTLLSVTVAMLGYIIASDYHYMMLHAVQSWPWCKHKSRYLIVGEPESSLPESTTLYIVVKLSFI